MLASKRNCFAAVSLLISAAAPAHHAMDGRTPSTFTEGLLSGLAHPVISVDHLAAVIAVGLLASLSRHRVMLVAAFSVATLCGVGLHVARVDFPTAELGIALSLLAFGWLLLRRATPAMLSYVVIVAGGSLHGFAYGESIIAAEASSLGAYLLGLSLIQTTIALGAGYCASFAFRAHLLRREHVSVASGALVALLGLALLRF